MATSSVVARHKRLPSWLHKRIPSSGDIEATRRLLAGLHLNTVCQSALCPNQGECFARRTATFMILGNICTRNCRFCAVEHGRPETVDQDEPERVAEAARRLGLKHVVVTSVTRDDLPDGGAGHFAATINALRAALPQAYIEVLTPDFRGDKEALATVARAKPDIFNHNVETVPRLYLTVRPQADYRRSLQVLKKMKELDPAIYTKSGLMVGLGETIDEVLQVMTDLRSVDCDILTIGQYLRPSAGHLEIKEFVTPETFAWYAEKGREMGFLYVASAPFVRSSYHAAEFSEKVAGVKPSCS
ncbi:Lipoyl synthase [Moorella glycerini]|uniref:Lipoyl synthase n=1 Tax=Neomoorella stamsii TaxID=1266720 RepID=A0A9X7P4Y2_9FIRM|nr:MULTISPECIES: lipoyl synthase [Moorella]PRR69645.1 Lipoyl synthase [Moorella stamsii]CEP67831.1 Lipoyl synthase [Moorella glycerini]